MIYRIYVPNNGQNQQGGVDLPSVTMVGRDGSLHPLAPCPTRDLAFLAQNYPEAAAAIQAIIVAAGSSDGSEAATCAPDQVAFAIPNKTGGYFPNPANKYIAAPALCYEAGRTHWPPAAPLTTRPRRCRTKPWPPPLPARQASWVPIIRPPSTALARPTSRKWGYLLEVSLMGNVTLGWPV